MRTRMLFSSCEVLYSRRIFGLVQWRGLEGDAGSLLTGWIDYVGRSTLDKDACFCSGFRMVLA